MRGRTRSRCLAVVAAMATASAASGATILEFDKWMQQIDQRSQEVQRRLSRRDADAATAEARELEKLYQWVEDYFARNGNAADAVQVSKEGRELAAVIVRSVEQDDYAAANTAALRMAHSCRQCHDVYKPLQ
jgi:hypothetical protein